VKHQIEQQLAAHQLHKKLENKETVVREKVDRRKDELRLNEIHAASGRKFRISRKDENTKSKEPL
jgi:hypothetical protein